MLAIAVVQMTVRNLVGIAGKPHHSTVVACIGPQTAKAAVEGKLATRADAAKHHGDFKAIVQGVNETLDAMVDLRSKARKRAG